MKIPLFKVFMKRRAWRSGAQAKRKKHEPSDGSLTIDETESINDDPWRVDRFMPEGPPTSEEDWWTSKPSSKDGMRKTFRNRGLEVWEKTRHEWRDTVEISEREREDADATTDRERSLSGLRRHGIIKGVTGNRHYELPSPMPLLQVVELFNDNWATED